MEEDILSKVIEVEKEIQKGLETEKVKAQEWLEKIKKESEEEIMKEEYRLKEAFESALEESGAYAERKSSEVLSEAVLLAERLKSMPDETLSEIITRHIMKILPAK
jgi:predicted adenine nucleotide alpha hydrolase (AANH) superfamily ATPase